MLLDLPTIFQHDNYSCGVVAVETSLRFDGIPVGRWVKQFSHPVVGTTAEVVSAMMHTAYGGLTLSGSLTIPILKHITKSGRPVLTLITDPRSGGGHWIVVRGVERGRVYYNCPTNGRESCTVTAFEERWQLSDHVGSWTLVRFGICGLPADR